MKIYLFWVQISVFFLFIHHSFAQSPPPPPPTPAPPPLLGRIRWKINQRKQHKQQKLQPNKDTSSQIKDYSRLIKNTFKDTDTPPCIKECTDNQAATRIDKINCTYNTIFVFVSKNITYPEKASKNNTTGLVYISFVIDKNGEMIKAYIKSDIGDGCGEEALRVIKLFAEQHSWTAGEVNGVKTNMLYNLPVEFRQKE